MAIPKSKSLQESIENEVEKGDITKSLEKSYDIIDHVKKKTFKKVKVYNDYVAVLRLPRESVIALPGSSEFSNIGIIVGFGSKCVNEFCVGQAVMLNPKGGVISNLDIEGYDEGTLQLFLEKNIFCQVENKFPIEIS